MKKSIDKTKLKKALFQTLENFEDNMFFGTLLVICIIGCVLATGVFILILFHAIFGNPVYAISLIPIITIIYFIYRLYKNYHE